MVDWYSQALTGMWRGYPGWTLNYALYSGHFVDDFGNMVRVYAADPVTGKHELM